MSEFRMLIANMLIAYHPLCYLPGKTKNIFIREFWPMWAVFLGTISRDTNRALSNRFDMMIRWTLSFIIVIFERNIFIKMDILDSCSHHLIQPGGVITAY